MKKIIGIHTWEPGLTTLNLSASSGGASWLSYLMEQIRASGNAVIWISESPSDFCPRSANNKMDVKSAMTMCDVIFMPWRWEMPDYPDRHKLYLEQWDIIENFKGRIVIHDEDHMISTSDMIKLRNEGVIITSPELFPLPHKDTLHFPNPFVDSVIQPNRAHKTCDAMYIGNNYGRIHQTKNYLGDLANLTDINVVAIYGNWMEKGPGRESPDEVKKMMPNVQFMGRLPNDKTRLTLASAFSTVHLCKPSYANSGFMTMRWAEAAAAGIPGFVPDEFLLPRPIRRKFERARLMVAGAIDVKSSIQAFKESPQLYIDAVETQREFVKEKMTIGPMIEILTSVEKR